MRFWISILSMHIMQSYLYLNHCDTRLENKLKSILSAEYEPRALKALALAFLSKLDASLVQRRTKDWMTKPSFVSRCRFCTATGRSVSG